MNATTKSPDTNLELAFDVGHSSIGWAVLQHTNGSATVPVASSVNILGCGVVTFRADDCLASTRRSYRRQRRHIRSTRQRIARMKRLLLHLGVLTEAQLNSPGCGWPWKLAAKVLVTGGQQTLTWRELWDVLRWYAHNRGYDANRRWSRGDAAGEDDDTEKVETAKSKMKEYGVQTMAETFCRYLGIDPLGPKLSSTARFKGLNAAFPRELVVDEVKRILEAHFGKLNGANETLVKSLFTDWRATPCPSIKVPKRYQGGLLFGQLVPRFDNRIIAKCPVTGEKVPSRNTSEFLNFRWAMQLANVRVGKSGNAEFRALTPEERKKVDAVMRAQGRLTEKEFKKAVRDTTGTERDNLDALLLHPDAKKALLLDPVQDCISSSRLQAVWPKFTPRMQKRVRGQLRRGKLLTLATIRADMERLGEAIASLDGEIQRMLDAAAARGSKKSKLLTRESLLAEMFQAERLDGRAAYSRPVLQKAFDEVMAGTHPKEEDGCLFVTEQMRQAQLQRSLAEQTNNHLVRHRLLILERLLRDIIKEFANGEKSRVGKITIEVNRDLREMSGRTAKEKAQDLGRRIADHHRVAEKLEEAFKGQRFSGQPIRVTPGLIRKGRIAEDLGWTCPYTGQKYEPIDLVTRKVDKDHIVPRSSRLSDSLDSLVITYSTINKWKGKRTAYRFVEQEQGKPVPDLPNQMIVSLTRYKGFVEALDVKKGHGDDQRRKKNRQRLLLTPSYEEEEFVPRDLTQTSQLVRLGAQALKRGFSGLDNPPTMVSLPGSVTGVVRKGWNLLGCLTQACPQVLDEAGDVRTKTEIRDITHLHHALDACVLGLASYFIPSNGSIWQMIIKRKLDDGEKLQLRGLGIFDFDSEGRFGLREAPDAIKAEIRKRLSEKRVVQHLPKRTTGMPVDQNMWRLRGWNDKGKAILEKHSRDASGKRKRDNPKAGADSKDRLVGWQPENGSGKLQRLKAVLISNENFGVALTQPKPVIVPFHKVHKRLEELKHSNAGKMPQVIRAGALVQIPKGTHNGSWRVFSIKNNANGVAFALGQRDALHPDPSKQNVLVRQLEKDGMVVQGTALTGIPVCPTTSSA